MASLDEMAAAWMGSLCIFGDAVGNIRMGVIADRIGALRITMITAALVGIILSASRYETLASYLHINTLRRL